jgi:hypothetical protein
MTTNAELEQRVNGVEKFIATNLTRLVSILEILATGRFDKSDRTKLKQLIDGFKIDIEFLESATEGVEYQWQQPITQTMLLHYQTVLKPEFCIKMYFKTIQHRKIEFYDVLHVETLDAGQKQRLTVRIAELNA